MCTAAKAALRRKKQHEHTLDQTVAQISTLEQQIYSIEAANINRETLAAMEKAGAAMKQIHGKLNIDTVDETMYVDESCYSSKFLMQPLIILI
jgi:charged multivesicular body protein 4